MQSIVDEDYLVMGKDFFFCNHWPGVLHGGLNKTEISRIRGS